MCFSSLRDSNVYSSFPFTIGIIVFSGSPVVKTLSFHCRQPGSVLLGELRSHMPRGTDKIHLGLLWWFSWLRICLQCGRPGFDPWVGKIPWRRERLPIPVFCPGEFHGLYSPWGCKESDTAEWLFTFIEIYIPQGKAENKFLLPIQQDDRKGSPRTIYPPWTHWFRNISSTDFLCKKSRESLKRSSS